MKYLIIAILLASPELFSAKYHCDGSTKKSISTLFHINGKVFKTGDTMYHSNGQIINSGSRIFHANGKLFKYEDNYYHTNGANLKRGDTIYYSNGRILKSDDNCYYSDTKSMETCPNEFTFREYSGKTTLTYIKLNLKNNEVLSIETVYNKRKIEEKYKINLANMKETTLETLCR